MPVNSFRLKIQLLTLVMFLHALLQIHFGSEELLSQFETISDARKVPWTSSWNKKSHSRFETVVKTSEIGCGNRWVKSRMTDRIMWSAILHLCFAFWIQSWWVRLYLVNQYWFDSKISPPILHLVWMMTLASKIRRSTNLIWEASGSQCPKNDSQLCRWDFIGLSISQLIEIKPCNHDINALTEVYWRDIVIIELDHRISFVILFGLDSMTHTVDIIRTTISRDLCWRDSAQSFSRDY
jgi:hypothetical protein